MTRPARRNLWTINTVVGDNRPAALRERASCSPRWSPDGNRLAFCVGGRGQPAVVWPLDGLRQTAWLDHLSRHRAPISWSPDGKSIAFTPFCARASRPGNPPPEKPQGANWAPPVKVVDSVTYRADGEGFLDLGFTHVFIVSVKAARRASSPTGIFTMKARCPSRRPSRRVSSWARTGHRCSQSRVGNQRTRKRSFRGCEIASGDPATHYARRARRHTRWSSSPGWPQDRPYTRCSMTASGYR